MLARLIWIFSENLCWSPQLGIGTLSKSPVIASLTKVPLSLVKLHLSLVKVRFFQVKVQLSLKMVHLFLKSFSLSRLKALFSPLL
jgi:hypothetical protein